MRPKKKMFRLEMSIEINRGQNTCFISLCKKNIDIPNPTNLWQLEMIVVWCHTGTDGKLTSNAFGMCYKYQDLGRCSMGYRLLLVEDMSQMVMIDCLLKVPVLENHIRQV